ncbi:chorismate-binding protein [Guyparkeria sp.]|uniref:chorismate-binding protein n=1 Tax=Guyparkeria sp. TaxID=2035736 RepID=UPI00356B4C02
MADTPHVERLVGALPELAAVVLEAGDASSHLFESVTAGGPLSRWSLLFSAPTRRIVRRSDGEVVVDGRDRGRTRFLDAFAEALAHGSEMTGSKDWQAVLAAHGLPGTFPFLGGWSFFLSYEMAAEVEPRLDLPRFALGDDTGFPLAVAEYHPAALVRDHESGEDILVHDGSREGERLADELRRAWQRSAETSRGTTRPALAELVPPDGPAYRAGVRRVRDYLFAGDVFQANLSHAWRFSLAAGVEPGDVYRSLCRRNPAPFAAWYRLDEGEIISSSPERLLRVAGGHAETRPIAGTRRRDPDPLRDRELVEQLRAHPKERAEHVMLIDLERNDLGRVCLPGTVSVDELMVVESYAHVHHLVSNVGGQLPADCSPVAALAACFPGGTITGCPKVRCMEILAELERSGRGPYTGSVGYVSNHGPMDSNILIRTVFLAPDGRGEFRTGAGIVADSRSSRELEETYEKARGVLDALGGEEALEQGRPTP